MEIVYALAALQGLIFIVFIFLQRHQTLANKLLGAYLLFICFSLSMSFLLEKGLIDRFHPLLGFNSGITYLCGPFLWLYALLITQKKQRLNWFDAVHLIPFLLHVVYVHFAFYGLSETEKGALTAQGMQTMVSQVMVWSTGGKILHSLIYYFMVYRLIKQAERTSLDRWASGKLLAVRWVKLVLIIILSISIIMALWFVVFMTFRISMFNALTGALINVLLFALVYALVFFAIKYPALFYPASKSGSIDTKKYAGSAMSEGESKQHWQKVLTYMTQEAPYQNPELTISDLADKLEMNTKLLSQVINTNSGQNFFGFVNDYRVEAFKERAILPANTHLTLLAIAMDCGFSSKSSFYALFKKKEGCTPRQYLLSNSPELALQ